MIRRRHIHSCVTALVARGFFLGALLNLFLLAPPTLHAHGPFDNSIHATLRTDDLEVSVVLGGEAAREILNRASPKNTVSLGGMGLKTLPAELAAFFIEINSGATTLVANQFTVVCDGLEYTFTATYPSPASGTLAFHATYFDSLEQIKPGTLVLADEAGLQMGSGVLTKGNASVELTLPQQPASTIATTEVETRPSATSPAIVTATATKATNATPPPRRNLSFTLILLAGLLALGGVWLVQRLLSKPVGKNP